MFIPIRKNVNNCFVLKLDRKSNTGQTSVTKVKLRDYIRHFVNSRIKMQIRFKFKDQNANPHFKLDGT